MAVPAGAVPIVFSAEQLGAWAGALFWPLVRLLALIGTAPAWSHRAVPVRVKVALALAVSALLAPSVQAPPLGDLLDAQFLATLARNLFVGLTLGFTLRIVFSGLEFAGQLMGLQIGLSFGGFFNPEAADTDNPVANFVSLMVLMVFVGMDGHLAMLAALQRSFEVVPVMGPGWGGPDPGAVAALGGQIFSIGLSLALPLLTVTLLMNLILGVMARVSPQLNLFSVGFPLTLAGGMLVLVLFLPYLEAPVRAALERALMLWPAA